MSEQELAIQSRNHDPGPDEARLRVEPVELAAVNAIPLGRAAVRVGTASWTDPTMTAPGVFYPRGADSPEERLQYYASLFPIVEVDATYYALPVPAVARAWADRTPPDFVFDAKAHALMTGQPTETRRLPKDLRQALPPEIAAKPRAYARDLPGEIRDEIWTRFASGLAPLASAGQLGSILLQYPRWFFPTSESRDEILSSVERLKPLRAAVEFRSGTWFNDKNLERTIRFLADNAIPMVMVDGPQGLKSSIPPLVAVTSPELAIVRFHGRRTETWEAKSIPTVERFRYLYSRDELEGWVPKLREAAEETRDMHVLMNNCYANYGSTNARELAALIADADVPFLPEESPEGAAEPAASAAGRGRAEGPGHEGEAS